MTLIISLSHEGNSIQLRDFDGSGLDLTTEDQFDALVKRYSNNGKTISPYLKEALSCNSHQSVLAFLKQIKDNPDYLANAEPYHINDDKQKYHEGHGIYIKFLFLNTYKAPHHPCDINRMIAFVEQRIEEAARPAKPGCAVM